MNPSLLLLYVMLTLQDFLKIHREVVKLVQLQVFPHVMEGLFRKSTLVWTVELWPKPSDNAKKTWFTKTRSFSHGKMYHRLVCFPSSYPLRLERGHRNHHRHVWWISWRLSWQIDSTLPTNTVSPLCYDSGYSSSVKKICGTCPFSIVCVFYCHLKTYCGTSSKIKTF